MPPSDFLHCSLGDGFRRQPLFSNPPPDRPMANPKSDDRDRTDRTDRAGFADRCFSKAAPLRAGDPNPLSETRLVHCRTCSLCAPFKVGFQQSTFRSQPGRRGRSETDYWFAGTSRLNVKMHCNPCNEMQCKSDAASQICTEKREQSFIDSRSMRQTTSGLGIQLQCDIMRMGWSIAPPNPAKSHPGCGLE